ncbi:hypothetical protein Ga0123462_0969 [Mariprofundus ferrinatatus]|uniref:AsmA family protein n=1 Tax=Mariprofundus ferrinatatus TaxID=1921087 RepID=A0A2K8L3C6_9PROT|nr:hypothetical protein [Mariprofundus ferrinatatus]ATX81838.1 hypothetical protein Ga0123462_0969 [Mariprofundus ferrinatatus]
MKKVLIGIVGLLVVVAGAFVFVWSNLDSIVKEAIQTYGSEAVKTEVSVADVKLQLETGSGTIKGLKVGNPPGFSNPNIFELGMISTKIDTSTVTENPVVIDEIIISAPAVVYEINKSGVSNVDVLKKSLGKSAGESGSKGGDEVKMVIRKLVVEGGQATVRIAALGDKNQIVKLPRIQLTDVGKKSGGATAAEVAQILSSKLLNNVQGSVMKLGVNQYLGKSADAVTGGALQKATGGIGGAGGADKALKGLLGN